MDERMKTTVEICTGSYADCMAAFHGGAERVELNSALSVGGLTASVAVLRRVKKETTLKVICMVRPRAGGFCYDEAETKIMMEEARLLLENGADGIAFGFLHADGTVHRERTLQMSELIHSFGKEAVFHRAFDVTKDPFQAMEVLLSCKIDRLLTSGQRAKAMQGAELIAQLQDRFGDWIEILAGSGVNAQNAGELLARTGIRQVHSSCKGYRLDPTTESEHVSYAYLDDAHAMEYDVVEETLVRALIDALSGS